MELLVKCVVIAVALVQVALGGDYPDNQNAQMMEKDDPKNTPNQRSLGTALEKIAHAIEKVEGKLAQASFSSQESSEENGRYRPLAPRRVPQQPGAMSNLPAMNAHMYSPQQDLHPQNWGPEPMPQANDAQPHANSPHQRRAANKIHHMKRRNVEAPEGAMRRLDATPPYGRRSLRQYTKEMKEQAGLHNSMRSLSEENRASPNIADQQLRDNFDIMPLNLLGGGIKWQPSNAGGILNQPSSGDNPSPWQPQHPAAPASSYQNPSQSALIQPPEGYTLLPLTPHHQPAHMQPQYPSQYQPQYPSQFQPQQPSQNQPQYPSQFHPQQHNQWQPMFPEANQMRPAQNNQIPNWQHILAPPQQKTNGQENRAPWNW